MTTALRNLVRLIDTAPGRLARAVAELWYDGLDAANWRGKALGLLVLLALATLPAWGGGPLIATMIAVLWLACAGQAWNLLAGFTGRSFPRALPAPCGSGAGAVAFPLARTAARRRDRRHRHPDRTAARRLGGGAGRSGALLATISPSSSRWPPAWRWCWWPWPRRTACGRVWRAGWAC